MESMIITGYCSENDVPVYNGKFKNINNATNKVNELITKKMIDFGFIRVIGRKKMIKLPHFFAETEEVSDALQKEVSKGETVKEDEKAKRNIKEEENPFKRFFDEIES